MQRSSPDEHDLITALYDGIFEQPLWSTLLDRLRTSVGADYAEIDFRPSDRSDGDPVILCAGKLPSAETARLYRQEIHKRDPVLYRQLREGRVYTLAELLNVQQCHDHRYFTDVLAPMGWNWMRTVRVAEPGGVSAWLSIVRHQRDFSDAHDALLGSLASHLRSALRAYVAIENERFRANVAAEAMRRLNFGWLSLDAGGRVLEMSEPAKQLLQRSTELARDRHDRLCVAAPAVDRELTKMVKACAADPGVRSRALHISRDPWIDLLIVPVQDRPDSASATPIAIAYLQGDNRLGPDRHEQIAELFGLLPSEARLALALSRGMTISEAAEALGLTDETARNYSKKIYAKTGARSRADLIRFILASVVPLA